MPAGKLVCEEVATNYADTVRWAIAGRDTERLDRGAPRLMAGGSKQPPRSRQPPPPNGCRQTPPPDGCRLLVGPTTSQPLEAGESLYPSRMSTLCLLQLKPRW